MQKRESSQKFALGFTLVEILIVVMIIGLIAAIVVPSFADFSRESEQSTFVSNIKSFAQAAIYYKEKVGEYLEDSNSGVCPVGFEDYIDQGRWERPTPLGGVWDAELNSFEITSGIGVDFNSGVGKSRDDVYMQEIDVLFDDGDLATGVFRKIAAGRYYYILAD